MYTFTRACWPDPPVCWESLGGDWSDGMILEVYLLTEDHMTGTIAILESHAHTWSWLTWGLHAAAVSTTVIDQSKCTLPPWKTTVAYIHVERKCRSMAVRIHTMQVFKHIKGVEPGNKNICLSPCIGVVLHRELRVLTVLQVQNLWFNHSHPQSLNPPPPLQSLNHGKNVSFSISSKRSSECELIKSQLEVYLQLDAVLHFLPGLFTRLSQIIFI